MDNKFINQLICDNNIEIIKQMAPNSVDLIFADPPYYMNLQKQLLRPNGDLFEGVNDAWDQFASLADYDHQAKQWISECLRILKPNGSFWVIGSFHNLHRIGTILQDFGAWIINEIVWEKTNPVPNFAGTRFVNAQETLLWVVKNQKAKYTFNYKTMKFINDNKQMKSVWRLPICSGNERLKDLFGKKVHSTQKPIALLERIILATTKYGDLILDPFSGTGTTACAAKKWGRKFIGIEIDPTYHQAAITRINHVHEELNFDDLKYAKYDLKPPVVRFSDLIKAKLIKVEDVVNICDYRLYFNPNGTLNFEGKSYSPNQLYRKLFNKPTNAWNVLLVNGIKISQLRDQLRKKLAL